MNDLGLVVGAFLVGLAITYGSVESVLFLPLRLFAAMQVEEGSMLETLIWCPICTGFWSQAVAGTLYTLDPLFGLRQAFLGVGLMLMARAVGLELVRSDKQSEIELVSIMRSAQGGKE